MKKNNSAYYMIASVILLTPSLILNPKDKLLQTVLFAMAIAALVTGIIAVKINREYMRAKEEEELEEQKIK